MKRIMYFLGIASLGMGIGGLGGGLYCIVDQHTRITTYKPIDAFVVRSQIGRSISGGTLKFEPLIDYEYEIDGVKRQSNQTTIWKQSGSEAWAVNIVQQYPLQKKQTLISIRMTRTIRF